MKRIRVLVNGAKGRMGATVCRAVSATTDLVLVGSTDLGDDLPKSLADSRAVGSTERSHP